MAITYETALKLKEAGFPQREANGPAPHNQYTGYGCGFVYPADNYNPEAYVPTLEELIEACGNGFKLERLDKHENPTFWTARTTFAFSKGTTPAEAVAALWLALNKKV